MGGKAGRITIGGIAAVLMVLTGCGGGENPSGQGARGDNPFGSPTAAPTMVVTETVTASPPVEVPSSVEPSSVEPSSAEPSQATTAPSASGSPTSLPSASVTSTAPLTGDPSKSPATFAQAAARVAAAGRARDDLPRFETPSGNIYCTLGDPVVGCEIADGSILDPAVCRGGATRFVGRIEFQPSGRALAVCNTDTIRLPSAPKVGYGTAIQGGGVVCLVQQSGVTCVDQERPGTGFTVRQHHYRVWNGEG